MKSPLRFKPVFYVNGILLLILSATMVPPMLIDLAHQSADWRVFAGSQIITAFVGFALMFTSREKNFSLNLRETFLMSTVSWGLLSLFSALPFYMSTHSLTYTQSFFEAMSGLTTTGATVLTGLDGMAKGILFWRILLHWLGGIGFLMIALAVLPLLQISGMQIFKTQSLGMEKILPSASQIVTHIFFIYLCLTIISAVMFRLAGMTLFDAVCHAMSALSTGGFSTHDSSVGYYKSGAIEWVAIVFMIAGALPFALYMRALKGDKEALFADSQVKTFLCILGGLSGIIALYVFLTGQLDLMTAVRQSLFMITSLMTTTGFVSNDYTLWGPLAHGISFVAMFLGACSGSTSGGLKIFRIQILWAVFQQQIRRLIVPHGVFQVHYSGKIVENSVQTAVAAYFFIYVMAWIFVTILLQLTGMDFVTSVTGALTALSNTGPGLGDIGPAGNFSSLSPGATWILSFAMLVGRMEFLTLFVLLAPRFWRG
jgi:trk system potassium uptake protein TrkH